MNKSFIKLLNKRQSILVKNILGIKYFSKSTSLLNKLGIEQFEHIYYKLKIYGLKQFSQNDTSSALLDYLELYYRKTKKPPKLSFLYQIDRVKELIESDTFERTLSKIDKLFSCNNLLLRQKIAELLNNFETNNSFMFISDMNKLLRVDFSEQSNVSVNLL